MIDYLLRAINTIYIIIGAELTVISILKSKQFFYITDRYARILARFWYVICVLVFVAVGAFSAVSFALYNAPDFADPTQVRDVGFVISRCRKSVNKLDRHT